ncbi:aspartyl protease family protein [Stigmatella sp. ncwal1]|uniref:Aspartyl protease family protein n=1 Tax=Stigmatella ashevillensis TaxID=2995309 RepID=A0ABT5DB39_9BACT|nr:aspartyl protease family protein [Stigmatella ashevillena]MDC0710872.1 aspartyl protease family protein [Stigmatella ashevillena]
MRRWARRLPWALLALAVGCAHAPVLAPEMAERLAATPGGYLSGEGKGLEQGPLLNNKDFVWSIAFSPDSTRVAYTHLGAKAYQLALWTLGRPPTLVSDNAINRYEQDLEAVAFSGDGAWLATAGRDGQVRLFEGATGAPRGQLLLEEPLTAVAFHPDGRSLVVGSAQGLLTVLSVPQLAYVYEVRAHGDAVSALAFAPDGTLYTGGWDKRVRVWSPREESVRPDQARARFERRGGFAVVRGAVNGKAQAVFALDGRTPAILLDTRTAAEAGIDVAFLKETLTVPTALGNTVAPLARGQSLRFKTLQVEGVDIAVCDACVPTGTQGVLGAPFTARFEISFDEAHGEAILAAKEGASGDGGQTRGVVLVPGADFVFEGHVNDVTVDVRGQRLGVAFSEQKAERTRTVYEREKKGIEEPQATFNAGALVDAASGRILQKWSGPRGVVSTASISPDGRSLAVGGWDKRLRVFTEGQAQPWGERAFGWSVRRVRFSPDGRWVGVAAWTPQNPVGDQESDPAAALFEVHYVSPTVERR